MRIDSALERYGWPSLLVAAGAGLTSCQPATMTPEQARSELAAVEGYYRHHDIGGGFYPLGFKVQGRDIVGSLLMATHEQQCAFRSDSSAQKQLAISIACPYDLDQVWTKLNPSHDIILEVECGGEVVYRHSCRGAHRAGASGDDDPGPAAQSKS